MTRSSRLSRLFAVAAAAGLIAAACGGDDDAAETTDAPETTAAADDAGDDAADDDAAGDDAADDDAADDAGDDAADDDAAGDDAAGEDGFVEGCGPQSVTDPSLISPEREVARCDPGFPAPQPLDETRTVTIASAFELEFNSPLLLAISEGEFEKENIEVEWVNMGYSDSVPQMANGDVDVSVGGIELALFNAGDLDLPVRATLGNYYPPHAGDYSEPQTGLWCRRDAFSNPEDPDLLETQDLKWSSSVGKGSVSVYYSIAEIERRTGEDLDVNDTVIEAIPNADALTALQNEGVDCAVLLDPFWLDIADDPDYILAASQTPGEPLGQYSYGQRMLEDRELGVAFARAFIRTVNTYFAGDYHQDDEVMEMISREINRPVEDLRLVDSLVMDWEIREGTTTRIQDLFINSGTITEYDEPVAEDKIVDRSFYLEAVGAL